MTLEIKNIDSVGSELDAEQQRIQQERANAGIEFITNRLKQQKIDDEEEKEKKKQEDSERFKKLKNDISSFIIKNATDSTKFSLEGRDELKKFAKQYGTLLMPGLQVLGKLNIDVVKGFKNINDPKFWEEKFKTGTEYEKRKSKIEKQAKLDEEIRTGKSDSLLGGLAGISPVFKLIAEAKQLFGKSTEQKLKDIEKYKTDEEREKDKGIISTGSNGDIIKALGMPEGGRGGMKGLLSNWVFSNEFQRGMDVYFKRMVKGLNVGEDGKITYTGQISKPKPKPKQQLGPDGKPVDKKKIAGELADKGASKKFISSGLANMAKFKGLPFPPAALAGAAPYILAGLAIGVMALYIWNLLKVQMRRSPVAWIFGLGKDGDKKSRTPDKKSQGEKDKDKISKAIQDAIDKIGRAHV